MDFENINQKLGGCGRYQYIVFFLLSTITFKYSGDYQAMTFALYVPKFKCSMWNSSSYKNEVTPNYTSSDQCQYKVSSNGSWMPCSRWTYEKDVLRTSFITEFDMVCNRAYIREMMFTSYFVGCLSSLGLTMFIDLIGRRYTLIVTLFLSVITTIWQVLTNSLWQQIVLLFVTGFLKTIYITLGFTTLIELMPMKKLDRAASNFWIFYGINYMACSLFAFYGRSWRAISLGSLLFSFLYFFYFCFIPETPRWLMLNKKRDKSFRIMSFIGKVNHRTLLKSDIDDWRPVQEQTGKFWNLFKYKTMVYRLLILNFAGWAFAFAYIGSSTDLTFASNNIFLTTLVMGFIEVPTGPLAGFSASRFGRKKSICGLSGVGIVGLLSMAFLEPDLSKSSWQPWFKLVFAMVAKLGFTSAWAIFDIIINELLPTTIRNSGTSLVYIAVSLGSIVAPIIQSNIVKWHEAAANLTYSGLLIITIILVVLFLPETQHLPVPQTIEQAASLRIHKEQEWKSNMILQAEELGMDHRPIADDSSSPKAQIQL